MLLRITVGWAVARGTVAVWVAGAGWVGGELREQPLPIPLAHAGRSGQTSARRGLAGGDLGFVGRPDTGPRPYLCAPIRACQLGCGLVA